MFSLSELIVVGQKTLSMGEFIGNCIFKGRLFELVGEVASRHGHWAGRNIEEMSILSEIVGTRGRETPVSRCTMSGKTRLQYDLIETTAVMKQCLPLTVHLTNPYPVALRSVLLYWLFTKANGVASLVRDENTYYSQLSPAD